MYLSPTLIPQAFGIQSSSVAPDPPMQNPPVEAVLLEAVADRTSMLDFDSAAGVTLAEELVVLVMNVVVLEVIGLTDRASEMLAKAACTLLSAAACDALMTLTDVTVDRGGRVEPEASTVTTLMLFTVLGAGGSSDRISVEVATPGLGVAEVELNELVAEDVGLDVVEDVCALKTLSTSEAIAAACEEASRVDVDDELDDALLREVLEVDAGWGSGIAPARNEVTVCVMVICACACGIMKFGAMLTAGCFSKASQSQVGLMDGARRCGKLL